jgi:hypothetical protein
MPGTKKFQLDYKFARYALLSGAAMIAAKPAKASIVYYYEPTPLDFATGSNSLDVNGDGVIDYYFTGNSSAGFILVEGATVTASAFTVYSIAGGTAFTTPGGTQQTDFIAAFNPMGDIAAYPTGQTIGPFLTWVTSGNMESFSASGTFFEGFEFFDTKGNEYFGFAEFDPGMLVGYAYNNTPDTPITTFDLTPAATPEPGTLALLALGAAGLVALKRRRA